MSNMSLYGKLILRFKLFSFSNSKNDCNLVC